MRPMCYIQSCGITYSIVLDNSSVINNLNSTVCVFIYKAMRQLVTRLYRFNNFKEIDNIRKSENTSISTLHLRILYN